MIRRLTLPLALLAAVVLAVSATHAARAAAAKQYVAPQGSGVLFLISGHGWGHGVGMGQWGAQGYAVHGYSYEDILAAYYPGTVLSQTTVRKIRVLLADGQKRLTVSSDQPIAAVDGTGATHTFPAGSTRLTRTLPYPAPLTLSPSHGATLTLGHAYGGKLVISLVNGKLRVINVVGLQEYVAAVVAAEMPSNWSPDALEAQAVACRSYALSGRRPGAAYDVSTIGQGYLGVAAETPQGDAAVNATKGQVLTYDGDVATTVYSSSTGGRTQSAVDAWGGDGAPYLVSVKDPYDTVSPYHDWGPVPVTGKALAAALGLTGKPLDATVKRNSSKRVAQFELTTVKHGVQTDMTASGASVAASLDLRSTWFTVGVLSLLPPSPNAAVSPGTRVTLTGTVRGVKDVVVQERPAGAAWAELGPVTPDPTGAFSIDVRPTGTTDYRLATAADAAAFVRITVSHA